MFPTAASHGRGVDQLDPGAVRFFLGIAWRDVVFLTQFFSNLIRVRLQERLAIRRSFCLRANAFLFLDQCGTRGVPQDSPTQGLREDGRAEYNRFRETGTERTSGTWNISRKSFKRSCFFPALGLRFNVSRRASRARSKTGGKELFREAGLRIRRQNRDRAL
jgi:hypothetical protein